MSMKQAIKQKELKRQRKRKREDVIHKILRVVIEYPFIIPFIKLGEFKEKKEKKYWLKHTDKLQKKALEELARYVERFMRPGEPYFIANARGGEDLDYSNVLSSQSFFSYSWSLRSKDTKIARYYRDIYFEKHALMGMDEEKNFHDMVFDSIEIYFKQNYPDLEITREIKSFGFNKYEVLHLIIPSE